MNASNDNSAASRLREWWRKPPRQGLARFISPWEYRHLRGFAAVRFAGGSVAATAGVICLAYGVPGWAAFFLAIAAANFLAGSWELGLYRSTSASA